MNRAKSSGATASVTGFSARTSSALSHHMVVARESLASLLATPGASVMTWLVIGIALALPAFLYLMLVNVGEVSQGWEGKPRISLYLREGTSVIEGNRLTLELQQKEDVMSAIFISPDQALVEFQRLSGFGDVLNTLDNNPLPGVIEIESANRDLVALRLQAKGLAERAEVDTVELDLEWLERLMAMLSFAQRLVAALGFVLALGVLLVIGNTTRLAIENRRSEIEIIKLVGGTDSFVRRPFLYLGLWYGLGGAIFSWVLVQASLIFLADPVEVLAQSYHNDFSLTGLGPVMSLQILGGGVTLGIVGALLAVGRHLKEIEPR